MENSIIHFLIIFIFLLYGAQCGILDDLQAEIRWFNQKVDHGSYANRDRFPQRYVISRKNWKTNGPILFYCGHQEDIVSTARKTGILWEMAPQLGALIILLEHRYYGSSLPYGEEFLGDLKYLGYLTVEQSLNDISAFLTDFKSKFLPHQADSPVLLVGSNYGGMLATWSRMRHPHLSVGALASSAPIFQLPGLYDCKEFYRIVTQNYLDQSEECVDSIRRSFVTLNHFSFTDNGLKFLQDTFKLCRPLQDIDSLKRKLVGAWTKFSMFNDKYPANSIQETCRILKGSSKLEDKEFIKRIAIAANFISNHSSNANCNSQEDDDSEAWKFQTCTEIIQPKCSNGISDMFEPLEWDFESKNRSCFKIYGTPSEENKLVRLFGGRELKSLTNIIFTNGDLDPYSAGGMLRPVFRKGADIGVLSIPGAYQSEDLRRSQSNDSRVLRDTRKMQWDLVNKWFDEFYSLEKF